MGRTIVEREIAAPSNDPLWDHQAQTLAFFATTPIGFDNSDPGTGKTRVQLEHYANRKPRGRCLILCTKKLMESAWGEDIEKYTPQLTYSLATSAKREQAFKTKTDIVVMNIDGVKWLADKANRRYLYEFDHLIIDEYTFFKHSTSQRSKALKTMSNDFKYKYGLSGTPNANSVMELWHPALILDGGARLGKSYYNLRLRAQTPTQIGPSANHVRWDDKPGMEDVFAELLKDITIRHEFEKVMTHVPPNYKHVKEFALTPKAKAIYDKMESDYIVALEGGEVAAVHAASLRTKLLQIASGAVYDGGEDGSYQLVDPGRYELVADLVGERAQCVVVFNWRHQKEQLCKAFDAAGISFCVLDGSTPDRLSAQMVRDFQAGKYKVILLHPRTGAHGLTLTAATTTILTSPIYEADLMKQIIMRIYRGTQDQVTNTIMIQAKGTVEKLVYERLFDKTARMEDLLALQARAHKPKKTRSQA